VRVGVVNDDLLAEFAQALGILAAGEVALAAVRAQDFSVGGDLKPLRYGLLGFRWFESWHWYLSFQNEIRSPLSLFAAPRLRISRSLRRSLTLGLVKSHFQR
jgi:hypothetical protein